MIDNIYTYDAYTLLKSIYQIDDLLLYSGHSFFSHQSPHEKM